jgi:hypothetical protein
MNRRDFTAAALTAPLLSGCFYDRFFDIEWDEEVLLYDKRVINVRLKYRFERLSRELTRYGGAIVPRDATLTFDAGGDAGQITQFFKGVNPVYLGQHNGIWYAVLSGGYYAGSRETPGQDWGNYETSNAQLAIKLVGKQFKPISIFELPDEIQEYNLLWLNGTVQEYVAFSGKTINLEQKTSWKTIHPLGVTNVRIVKPKLHSQVMGSCLAFCLLNSQNHSIRHQI